MNKAILFLGYMLSLAVSYLVISGCTANRIKDIQDDGNSFKNFEAPYQDLAPFIAKNYNNGKSGLNTVKIDLKDLSDMLNKLDQNTSAVYVSIIHTDQGKSLVISDASRMCFPEGICCPPNCGPGNPPPPSKLGILSSVPERLQAK